MKWLRFACCFAFLLLAVGRPTARAAASDPAVGSARLPRLYIVPVQPVSADVSPLVARRVSARLRVDLSGEASLEVLPALQKTAARVAPGAIYRKGAAPAPDERKAAAALLQRGEAAYRAARYAESQRLLLQAIARFERSVAHLEDVDAVARAFAWLGLALLRQGKRALAVDAIETAYALDPTLKMERWKMPRSMRRLVLRTGRRALRRRKGAIRVTTTPVGARVFVDGDEKGSAPVRWPEVIPGRHYVSARASGRLSRGQVVLVKPGQTVSVTLSLPPAAPQLSSAKGLAPAFQAEVIRRIRRDLVDRRLKPLLGQLAARVGADYVLLGGVGRDPAGGYRTRSFLYRHRDQKLVELDTVRLDAELLRLAAVTGKVADATAAAVAQFPASRDITYVRRAQVAAGGSGRGAGAGIVGLQPGSGKGRVHATRKPWYLRWSFWGTVIGVAVAGGLVGLGVGVYQATHQPVRGYTVGVEVR